MLLATQVAKEDIAYLVTGYPGSHLTLLQGIQATCDRALQQLGTLLTGQESIKKNFKVKPLGLFQHDGLQLKIYYSNSSRGPYSP